MTVIIFCISVPYSFPGCYEGNKISPMTPVSTGNLCSSTHVSSVQLCAQMSGSYNHFVIFTLSPLLKGLKNSLSAAAITCSLYTRLASLIFLKILLYDLLMRSMSAITCLYSIFALSSCKVCFDIDFSDIGCSVILISYSNHCNN